jgi:probable phosphoglycerate mutase
MKVVLIRHAHSEANAKSILAGRLPNVNLSAKGIAQSEELAQRLGVFPIHEIRISPMVRCSQTISPWLKTLPPQSQKKVVVDENINEVDYGSWSGKKLTILRRNRLWNTVQNIPSAMYFPGGEGIAGMQTRAMLSVHQGINSKAKNALVLVSHGDVIKAIIAHALGMHLDKFQRLVIDPASISILEYHNGEARVTVLNDTQTKLQSHLGGKVDTRGTLGGGAGR